MEWSGDILELAAGLVEEEGGKCEEDMCGGLGKVEEMVCGQ